MQADLFALPRRAGGVRGIEGAAAWGANCGPLSLASLFDVELERVRREFSAFLGYTTVTAMTAAVDVGRPRS